MKVSSSRVTLQLFRCCSTSAAYDTYPHWTRLTCYALRVLGSSFAAVAQPACSEHPGADRLGCRLLAGSYGKVYRAVRGGVQDVAVKVLNHTENDPRQIAAFEKVRRSLMATLCMKHRLPRPVHAAMRDRMPQMMVSAWPRPAAG